MIRGGWTVMRALDAMDRRQDDLTVFLHNQPPISNWTSGLQGVTMAVEIHSNISNSSNPATF